MPMMYNLRSSQKKKANTARHCYLQNYLSEGSPEAFNPKVCLKRLKLLESNDVHNSTFYLEKDRITLKQERSKTFKKGNIIKIICSIFLFVVCLIYYTDEIQFYGMSIAEKVTEYQPTVQNYYNEATVVYKNLLNSLSRFKFTFSNAKVKSVKYKVPEKKIILKTRSDFEIQKLVEDYLQLQNKSKPKSANTTLASFIEEQCHVNNENSLERFFDESNLTDYALESRGAEIVTVFDTEPYGTRVVKLLNFYIWPPLGQFLMNRFKYLSSNGPNSILVPWKKPGDCWAFKGSRGRVRIKLSEKIFITAITVDHIPKTDGVDGSCKSAPKKFSIFGVEPGTLSEVKYLDTYEYKSSGPASQTFLVQPKVKVPFGWIDLRIESNHGNDNYTCVYKIRVHGHK